MTSSKGHRRHSRRSVGWQQRQAGHTKAARQEHGSTVIDRAMGREWTSQHGELLRAAHRLTTPREFFYVHRKPGQPWHMGSYTMH